MAALLPCLFEWLMVRHCQSLSAIRSAPAPVARVRREDPRVQVAREVKAAKAARAAKKRLQLSVLPKEEPAALAAALAMAVAVAAVAVGPVPNWFWLARRWAAASICRN